jgi:flagellin
MGLSISANTMGANSAKMHLGQAVSATAQNINRLASGNRIARASDDIAAMGIGTQIQSNLISLRQLNSNAAYIHSALEVADDALGQITELLQAQKAIAVQANSSGLSDLQRVTLNAQYEDLDSEIDRVIETTRFNDTAIFDVKKFNHTTIKDGTFDLLHFDYEGAMSGALMKVVDAFFTQSAQFAKRYTG